MSDPRGVLDLDRLPPLLTAEEAAEYLRLTLRAFYAAVERGQIPGVLKLGRRVRVRREALLSLAGAPSPRETRR